jgi:Spy/CpxP family protein refolding chaperone
MEGSAMNNPTEPVTTAAPPRQTRFNRMTLIAFLAGATLAGGAAALAGAPGLNHGHHGMTMHGTHSEADARAHVDHVLKHFYAEVDATDAQKAQIGPLVKQAVNDLLPLHKQLQAAHAQAIEGLTQPNVDRAALESARETHMQLADQASRRLVQLFADVSEVLTPVQRTALAEHLKHLHGMAGA